MSILSTGTTTGTACSLTADTSGDCIIKTGSSATTAMTISGSTQAVTLAAGLTGTTATMSGAMTAGSLVLGSSTLSAPSGSAPSYTCRAWVNFNGTGTVAIRASGNVSSITDNGTGDYTVNFTTAMPDADYNFTFGTQGNFAMQYSASAPSTSALRVGAVARDTGALTDNAGVSVSIFR